MHMCTNCCAQVFCVCPVYARRRPGHQPRNGGHGVCVFVYIFVVRVRVCTPGERILRARTSCGMRYSAGHYFRQRLEPRDGPSGAGALWRQRCGVCLPLACWRPAARPLVVSLFVSRGVFSHLTHAGAGPCAPNWANEGGEWGAAMGVCAGGVFFVLLVAVWFFCCHAFECGCPCPCVR